MDSRCRNGDYEPIPLARAYLTSRWPERNRWPGRPPPLFIQSGPVPVAVGLPCWVFEPLHLVLLDRLSEQGQLDWSRLLVDLASLRAKTGGLVGANPVDRGKPGNKLHLATDARGETPLAVLASAANVNDWVLLRP